MPHEPTNLVLGRGEVYFDRFIAGTRIGEGERYLGNTPSFRIQQDVSTQTRATSYRGRKVEKPDLVVSRSTSVDFVTDNVDLENLAIWFGSSVQVPDISLTTITETFTVKRGRFIQLGKSQNIAGTRNVRNVVVRRASTVISQNGNYVLNGALGRIEILRFATTLRDGDVITVQFTVVASDTAQVAVEAQNVMGSLRFVSLNEGIFNRQQNDYYFPMVSITPRGQTDLKGDEWQQWGFEGKAYNLSPTTEQLYVTRAARKLVTSMDEETIIDEVGSLDVFTFWEDQLNTTVNVDWPPALELEGI